MHSIDAILEDKVLMMTHVDLQKTFPDIPCVSQMNGGPSLRFGDTKECLNNPFRYRMCWERHWLTGNVGNFYCELIQHPGSP